VTPGLEYTELAVPAHLARHVRVVWRLRGPASPGEPEPIVPDGCVELVLNFGEAALETRDGRTLAQPKFMVVGRAFTPTVVQLQGDVDMWGVRIQPGAASSLLGAPAPVLSQRSWDLHDLTPPFAAAFSALTVRPSGARGEAIMEFLTGAVRSARELPLEVDELVDYALNGRGELAVRAMAEKCGLNVRRVQRLFQDNFGFGPKLLMRLGRFQRALAMSRRDPPPTWSEIALRCEYHDQAHLVRDAREFALRSPTQVFGPVPGLAELFIAK
jgi:AraC-like DNA-binding protein